MTQYITQCRLALVLSRTCGLASLVHKTSLETRSALGVVIFTRSLTNTLKHLGHHYHCIPMHCRAEAKCNYALDLDIHALARAGVHHAVAILSSRTVMMARFLLTVAHTSITYTEALRL